MKPQFNNRYHGMACRVCLVMEKKVVKPIELDSPDEIYKLVKEEMITSDREILLSVLLNGQNRLIGVETVSIGNLNSCFMTPREILKSAVLANAASIVICHNHPSGELTPSSEDIEMTRKLIEAGELLGILVHDHLIISHEGYRSIMPESKSKRKESNNVF